MIASNITEETIRTAARLVGVSVELNATSGTLRRWRLKVSPGAHRLSAGEAARLQATIGDTRYQRTSATQCNKSGDMRRVAAVCWHGFRDFFRACYELEPEARFKTAFDDWRGSEDFEDRFAGSGHKNIGSNFSPMFAAEACRCGEEGFAG